MAENSEARGSKIRILYRRFAAIAGTLCRSETIFSLDARGLGRLESQLARAGSTSGGASAGKGN